MRVTSTDDVGPDRILFLTNSDLIGYAAMWVASLLVAGVVGYRLARRQQLPAMTSSCSAAVDYRQVRHHGRE